MEMGTPNQGPALPRTRAELLARIDRTWRELAATVDGASEAWLTTAGSGGGWSVKDHLSHLRAWEGRLLAFLRGQTLTDYFALDPAFPVESGIDELNARIIERDRATSLTEVLESWRETHWQVVTALESLSDADLTASRPSPDNPDDLVPLLGSGVLDGNTYEHYAEHGATIRRMLSGASSPE